MLLVIFTLNKKVFCLGNTYCLMITYLYLEYDKMLNIINHNKALCFYLFCSVLQKHPYLRAWFSSKICRPNELKSYMHWTVGNPPSPLLTPPTPNS